MAAYEQALQALYQAPIAEFTSLRGRLAAEMRAKGDRPSAGRLAARRRPTISAWAVNQLYWRARPEFDDMRDAADRLRGGDLGATADYRRALAALRRRAAALLEEAGHAASDAVLARVTNTLAAVAAVGFDPDEPGMLAADRDPPGFDIGPVSALGTPQRRASAARPEARRRDEAAEQRSVAARQRRVTELAERRREAERARQMRERERLERELAAARVEVQRREKALGRLQAELRSAHEELEEARTRVRALEHSLGRLGDRSS